VVSQQLAAAQVSLNGGGLNPQPRAAGEKSLIGLRTQIGTMEKALQVCRGQ